MLNELLINFIPLDEFLELFSNKEDFKSLINKFFKNKFLIKEKIYNINNICKEYNFQKRRFYDLINVLEAINYCKKTSVNQFQWIGYQKLNYIEIKNDNNNFISINLITKQLINSFFQYNTKIINLKKLAKTLSLNNNRYKTLLCKLYQVSYILQALNIIKKNNLPGEIELN